MQHSTESCWQIRLPKNLSPRPPAFHFGDWVPLSSFFQRRDGVIWFGRIRSIIFDGQDFYYSVELPRCHPQAQSADFEETRSEEQILEAIRRLGV